jgi:hypothetical protein
MRDDGPLFLRLSLSIVAAMVGHPSSALLPR